MKRRELAPARAQRDRVGEAHLGDNSKVRTGDRGRRQTARALPAPPDAPTAAHVRDPLPGGGHGSAWQGTDGLVRLRAPDEDSLDAAPLRARARRRHDRVRPRDSATTRCSAPRSGTCTGCGRCGAPTVAHALLRAVCGQLIEARRRWRSSGRSCARAATRRPDRHALGALSPAAAPPARARDALAPRRSSASAARSISRGCAPCRSRRSRRGSCASAGSGRGRSASSRCKGSAATGTGSSATSASSSCAPRSAAAGSSSTRRPSCSPRTRSGPGSRASTCCAAGAAGSSPARAPTAPPCACPRRLTAQLDGGIGSPHAARAQLEDRPDQARAALLLRLQGGAGGDRIDRGRGRPARGQGRDQGRRQRAASSSS